MEKILCLAVFVAVIAAVVSVPQAPPAALGAPGPGPDGKKLACANGILGPNEETKKKIGACKDPAVWGTEEGKKNPNCDGKCIGEVFGYWGQDGKPDKDTYFKWIDSDFAPHQEFAKKHITNCFEQFATKIDPNDATCEYTKKFDSCGWEMQPKLVC